MRCHGVLEANARCLSSYQSHVKRSIFPTLSTSFRDDLPSLSFTCALHDTRRFRVLLYLLIFPTAFAEQSSGVALLVLSLNPHLFGQLLFPSASPGPQTSTDATHSPHPAHMASASQAPSRPTIPLVHKIDRACLPAQPSLFLARTERGKSGSAGN